MKILSVILLSLLVVLFAVFGYKETDGIGVLVAVIIIEICLSIPLLYIAIGG